MFGPPHIARGAEEVGVENEIVGTSVTMPDAASGSLGAGVHVGGRTCGVNGSTGPNGCEANI